MVRDQERGPSELFQVPRDVLATELLQSNLFSDALYAPLKFHESLGVTFHGLIEFISCSPGFDEVATLTRSCLSTLAIPPAAAFNGGNTSPESRTRSMRVSQAARAISRFSSPTRRNRRAFLGFSATTARVVPFHRETSLCGLRAGDGVVISLVVEVSDVALSASVAERDVQCSTLVAASTPLPRGAVTISNE